MQEAVTETVTAFPPVDTQSQPAFAPPPAAATPEPPPPVAPPPPPPANAYQAPEATIYVALIGEGISSLRSVKAEHLGRDIYRIIESMPENESWRYQPGQIVRCKKQKLSSGKAMVAIEEVALQRM